MRLPHNISVSPSGSTTPRYRSTIKCVPELPALAVTFSDCPALKLSWLTASASVRAALSAALASVSRKARVSPLWSPTPTICPASLIPAALVSVQPEPAGSRLLRSLSVPFCQRKARLSEPSEAPDQPTTCPAELTARAWLDGSPDSVPRSCIPAESQRKARNGAPPAAAESPTTWPGPLTPRAVLKTCPGSVPSSGTTPLRQTAA